MNKQLLLNLNFWENAADLWLGNKKLQEAFSLTDIIGIVKRKPEDNDEEIDRIRALIKAGATSDDL